MATNKAKSKKVKKVVSKSAKKPTKTVAKAKAKSKPSPKAKAKVAAPVKKTALKLVKSQSKDWSQFLTPLDDRIIVSYEVFEKTSGGLFIPSTVTDKPQQGRVLAVGRGHINKKGKLRPMDVKAGDEVLFAPYAGNQVEMQGQTVLILRESDVLGIVG